MAGGRPLQISEIESSARGIAALSEEILSSIESELSAEEGEKRSVLYRAHRMALKNWLGKYRPVEESAVKNKILGFEEAYHHLKEMSALKQALRVKRVSLRVRKQLAVERWRAFEAEARGDDGRLEAE